MSNSAELERPCKPAGARPRRRIARHCADSDVAAADRNGGYDAGHGHRRYFRHADYALLSQFSLVFLRGRLRCEHRPPIHVEPDRGGDTRHFQQLTVQPIPAGTETTAAAAVATQYGSATSINSGQAASSWPGKFNVSGTPTLTLRTACHTTAARRRMRVRTHALNVPTCAGTCTGFGNYRLSSTRITTASRRWAKPSLTSNRTCRMPDRCCECARGRRGR